MNVWFYSIIITIITYSLIMVLLILFTLKESSAELGMMTVFLLMAITQEARTKYKKVKE